MIEMVYYKDDIITWLRSEVQPGPGRAVDLETVGECDKKRV